MPDLEKSDQPNGFTEGVYARGHTAGGQLLDASRPGDLAAYQALRDSLIMRREALLQEAQEIADKLGLDVAAKTPKRKRAAPAPAAEVLGVTNSPSRLADTLTSDGISVIVLTWLKDEGGYHNVAAIAAGTNLENRQVSLALSDLKASKQVKSKGKARGTTWATK